MAKILVLLVLLAVVLGIGDVEARLFAQHQLEKRIEATVTTGAAHVSISSFPFLGRLVVSGTVPKIEAHLANVSSGLFTFDAIDFSVTGVKLDRTALIDNRHISVKGIDHGTVSADMTQAGLDRALGNVPVRLGNGTIQLTVRGISVTGRVSVVGNQLQVVVAGAPVGSVAIPKLTVLPCVPTPVVTTGHLQLSCTFNEIPPALLNQAAKVTA